MKNRAFLTLICLSLLAPSLLGQTDAPGSANQLQQLTAQLQQSPGNEALREKIIALALTLNPRPATPDAPTMAEGAAEYAFKNAKATSDYSDAAKQYEKALLLAPWLAADYFNCGVTYEKAGDNKEAIHSFNLYLLAAPNADDALAVKKRIGGLQYAEQKAVDEANSPAAQLEKLLKSLDGGIWIADDDRWGNRLAIKIKNNVFRLYYKTYGAGLNTLFDNELGYSYYFTTEPVDLTNMLHDHELDASFAKIGSDGPIRFIISDDYQTITEYGGGGKDFPSLTYIFKRIR